jgi:hypothetical protein
MQKRKMMLVIGVIVLVVVLAFILSVIRFGWDWTGFTSVTGPILKPNQQYRSAKTLWDVLQLLAALLIPIVIVVFTTRFTKQQSQTEHETTLDNQREILLQDYLNKIADLLLDTNRPLRKSVEDDEVRKIARVWTLTALRRLDGERKGSVIRFLHEANLINKDNYIVDLRGADLKGANLEYSHLEGARLRGVHLEFASLQGASLEGANLLGVRGITREELERQTSFLEGATMPDGEIYS